jgi:type II secretory pathway pseudopilin PulG
MFFPGKKQKTVYFLSMIEITVVISIILVLIVMLMPVLGKAREKAKLSRWLEYVNSIQAHPNLVVLYDFQDKEGSAVVNKAIGPDEYLNFNADLYNGTINNGHWQDGRWIDKGAIYFNESAWIAADEIPQEIPTYDAEQSILWWHKVSAADNNTRSIIDLTNIDQSYSVQLGFQAGKVTVWDSEGDTLAQASDPYEAETWTQCCYTLTVAGSVFTNRLYVNGLAVDTRVNNTPMDDIPSYLYLGRANGGGEYFEGYIDELMIFNRVLTEDEITENHQLLYQ